MKSSLLLVAASALLASAGPLLTSDGPHSTAHARTTITEWETVYSTTYITTTIGRTSTPSSLVTSTATPQPTPPALKPVEIESPPPEPVDDDPPQPEPVNNDPLPPQPLIKEPPPEPVTKTQPVTTAIPPPAENFDQQNKVLQQAVLDIHNQVRANHSADALTWNETLAGAAGEACHCGGLKHTSAGQNLIKSVPLKTSNFITVSAEKLVTDTDDRAKTVAEGMRKQWYADEEEIYRADGNYGKTVTVMSMGDFEKWGHFSQMVWKDSKEVGCRTTYCDAEGLIMTSCNYLPAGNNAGSDGDGYQNNVLPRK